MVFVLFVAYVDSLVVRPPPPGLEDESAKEIKKIIKRTPWGSIKLSIKKKYGPRNLDWKL